MNNKPGNLLHNENDLLTDQRVSKYHARKARAEIPKEHWGRVGRAITYTDHGKILFLDQLARMKREKAGGLKSEKPNKADSEKSNLVVSATFEKFVENQFIFFARLDQTNERIRVRAKPCPHWRVGMALKARPTSVAGLFELCSPFPRKRV